MKRGPCRCRQPYTLGQSSLTLSHAEAASALIYAACCCVFVFSLAVQCIVLSLIVQGTPLKTHHAVGRVSRLEHSWRTAVQRRHEAHRRRARRMSVSLKKTLADAVLQWTNRAAPFDRHHTPLQQIMFQASMFKNESRSVEKTAAKSLRFPQILQSAVFRLCRSPLSTRQLHLMRPLCT